MLVHAPDFSLDATLGSGHSFCWQPLKPGHWQGWIGDTPLTLTQQFDSKGSPRDQIEVTFLTSSDVSEEQVIHTLGLETSWQDWTRELYRDSKDNFIDQALRFSHGLRMVREPWWECTANFICSSLKQIPHIRAINHTLRRELGTPVTGPDGFKAHLFPTPEQLVEAGEKSLRNCRLGYRAKHLSIAAEQVANGNLSFTPLNDLTQLPTPDAVKHLCQLRGVGEKVAHCILLFAGRREDAFPIDVWITRVLKDLYHPRARKKRSMRDWQNFARRKFGERRGITQHFLFHWYRHYATGEIYKQNWK